MKKILPVLVGLVIVIGGGAFYGGLQYANAKKPAQLSRGGNANFRMNGNNPAGNSLRGGMGGGRGQQGGFAGGEILSKDNNSVTVKLRDGGSQIIFLSTSTQIMKSVPGSVDDLQAGQNIMVSGSANQDGTVTAQVVQLRPAMPANQAGK